MKMLMLSVRDAKAEIYHPPVFVRTRGEGIRSFSAAVNSDHEFGKHAEDYALFELGAFDPLSGIVEGHLQPVHVINALSLRTGDAK